MAHPSKTSEQAIIAATLEIIEHDGLEHLSVRAVARKLGLAPNALYYRFPERKILEAAVAAEGMRRINAVLKRTVARSEGEAAVRSACRAYLRFGHLHPAVYAMMMKEYPKVPGLLAEREGFREVSVSLFKSLGDQRAALKASSAWRALLHGLVELEMDGMLEPRELSAGASFGVSALMAGLSTS
jgi:AcrR family transcriptional regulator